MLQKSKCLKASADGKQHKCGTGVVDVPSVGRLPFIIWELI